MYAGIEDLRDKREEINKQISKEEDEKAKVQNDLTVLSKRLTTLNDSIARKVRRVRKPAPQGRWGWSQQAASSARTKKNTRTLFLLFVTLLSHCILPSLTDGCREE